MRVVDVTLFAFPARYRVMNSLMLYTLRSLMCVCDTPLSDEPPDTPDNPPDPPVRGVFEGRVALADCPGPGPSPSPDGADNRPPKVDGGRAGLMFIMPEGVLAWDLDDEEDGAGVEADGVPRRGANCRRSNTLSMYTEGWVMRKVRRWEDRNMGRWQMSGE